MKEKEKETLYNGCDASGAVRHTLTVPAIFRDMERGRITLAMSYTSL